MRHLPRPACTARSLALAVALALGAPAALADDARTAELEARIAELERMVARLLEQQAAPPPAPEPPPAPAQAPVAAVSASNRGTNFTYGGFIKADFMFNRFNDGALPAGSLGRDFFLPGLIPVGGSSASSFDAHAKQTRFWFATDTVTDGGDRIGSRIEMDFGVPVGGDERQTNTYNPVVRQAFFTWNDWLFGQAWTTFQEVRALPEGADFIGPTNATVFARQAMARYTSGPFAIALENPSTTITPFGGGARIVDDSTKVPDLAARWTTGGDWGFFTVSGVLRQLRIEQGALRDSATGYGLSLAGRWNIGDNDIRYMVTGGRGLGRYLALNFGEDAVLDANGQLDVHSLVAGFVAYRHVWAPGLRSNFTYSAIRLDQDATLTGPGANKSSDSFSANLLYSPTPRIDLGMEYRWADRELESGARGRMNRLHALARYTF